MGGNIKRLEEKEIWRAINDYEGLYDISNFGRIKSFVKGRILKNTIGKNGYIYCVLSKNKSYKTFLVHRLVAFAFIDIPNSISVRHVVDHINGIRSDNRVENLRFVTDRFNCTEGFRYDKDKFASIYPGVSFKKDHKKFRANISINGKRKHLGYFENEIDAAEAYNKELLNIINNTNLSE